MNAERFTLRPSFTARTQRKGGVLAVFWHDRLMAFLHYGDACKKRIESEQPDIDVVPTEALKRSNIVKSRYKELPAVIYNLHPDHSFIGKMLNIQTRAGFVGKGKNAFSNFQLIMVTDTENLPDIKIEDLDILEGRLSDFKDAENVFTGNYQGLKGIVGDPTFDEAYINKWQEIISIVFSGKERKIPLFLNEQGSLLCANEQQAFTHIGKFPQLGGRESLAVLEYMGMEVSKAMGMETAECALIDLGPNLPPMYVTERTDIPTSQQEVTETWRIIQDMWSIVGMDPKATNVDLEKTTSYEEVLGRWISASRKYAPENLEENVKAMLRRVIGCSIISDNDLHAKNLSGLFEVNPENLSVRSLKFAPVYDAVINSWASREGTPLHYKLTSSERGKPSKIGMHELLTFLGQRSTQINGKKYCVFETKEEAQQFILDMAKSGAERAVELAQNPPACVLSSSYRDMLLLDMQVGAALVVERARALGAEVPDFDTGAIFRENKRHGSRARGQEYEKRSRRSPREIDTTPGMHA